MAARGAFLKLDPEQYEALTKAPTRRAFRDRFDEIQKSLPTDRIGYMDKAWWGLFCILPAGLLDSDPVVSFGRTAALGSQKIYIGAVDDRYLSLFSSTRVGEIASAWKSIDVDGLRTAYFALAKPAPRARGLLGLIYRPHHWYAEFVSEQDWEYVFDYCLGAQEFFQQASQGSLAALFEGSG